VTSRTLLPTRAIRRGLRRKRERLKIRLNIKAEQNNMENKTDRVSTSILSLNDDCLTEIISYLDDVSSFYDFALTCKRFHQATLSTQDWHVNVKIRKMKFYSLKFIIDEDLIQQMPSTNDLRLKFPTISALVRLAATYRVTKPTYTNVLNVWKSRGPVAAKLFTWISDLILFPLVDGAEFARTEFTLQLPARFLIPRHNQVMKITRIIHDDFETRELMIKFESGSQYCFETSCIFIGRHEAEPECYLRWSEEEMTRVIEPLQPAIDILQEELGETNPPITARFFL